MPKLIKIDKDSRMTIAKAWVVIALVLALVLILSRSLWVIVPTVIILLALAFFIFWFHRIPDRTTAPGDECTVTSAADGEVVIVERVYEGEYFKSDCMQVSIYMDFFDVHANFWPMTGEVSYYRYHPGKYLLAFLPKASEKNEHSSTAIRNSHGEIFFKQIAGTFARRIVCYSEEAMHVERGEQCGIIKFGSRIDVFLPLDAEILVNEGDRAKARITPIARLR